MAKIKTVYRCTDCGAEYSKWQGRCDTCGGWNTLVEEAGAPKVTAKGGGAARRMGGSASMGEGGSVAVAPRLRALANSSASKSARFTCQACVRALFSALAKGKAALRPVRSDTNSAPGLCTPMPRT